MLAFRPLNVLATAALLACVPPDGETGGAAEPACGDVDGDGGDTGDVPNVLGTWSATFYYDTFYDSCTAIDDQSELDWIGSLNVMGTVPDAIYTTIGTNETERFWGAVDRNGGITFTGQHEHVAGTMYANFSGLVYHDQGLDRTVINGYAFLGLDVDGDTLVDCTGGGHWSAKKSGQ